MYSEGSSREPAVSWITPHDCDDEHSPWADEHRTTQTIYQAVEVDFIQRAANKTGRHKNINRGARLFLEDWYSLV